MAHYTEWRSVLHIVCYALLKHSRGAFILFSVDVFESSNFSAQH